MASSWFDESYYLTAKAAYNNANAIGGLTTWTSASVQASLNAAGMTAEQHYTLYGWTEGLAPNAYYVEGEYVNSKVAALNAGAVGGRTNWTAADFYASLNGTNPFMHYVQYGAYETGVEPSTGFNDDTYYADKATYNNANSVGGITTWTADTVKAAFQAAGLTPIGHYELYGATEAFYTPTPTPTPGQSYTLTNGADRITGTTGDDIFNGNFNTAGQVTFQSFDILNGGGGEDTLFAQNPGTMTTSTTTLQGIENVHIIGATGGNSIDLTSTTGIQKLYFDNPAGAYTATGLAAGLTDINLSGTLAGNQRVTVQNSAISGTTDSINLNLNSTGTTARTVEIAPVSGANGYETVVINNTGASNILLDDLTSTSLTTVNSVGSGALTLAFTPTTVTTFNASTATGAQNVTFGAANITATGGSGDDTFNFGATYNSSDVINGGTGVNKLQITTASVPTAAMTNLTNIQKIGIDNVAANTAIDMSYFGSGITNLDFGTGTDATRGINNGTTATVTKAASTFTSVVDVDGAGTGVLSVAPNTGSSDIFNLNLRSVDTSGAVQADLLGSLVGTGYETVNITTSATSGATVGNTFGVSTLTDADATTLNINTTSALSLGATASTLTALGTVNGGTSTGAITLGGAAGGAAFNTANTGAVITTGSGNDSVHLNVQASGVLKALDLGTQASAVGDTLILDSATGTGSTIVDLSSTTDQISQINGGANSAVQLGIENIDLSGFASGTATAQITGSSAANTIIGTAGADVISAGDGNDTITGGLLADDITGGNGRDVFNLTSSATADTIRDFTIADDRIDFNVAGLALTLKDGNSAAITAATTNVTKVVTGATAVAAGDTVFEVTGTYANAAAFEAAIEAGGASQITLASASTIGDDYLMVWTDTTGTSHTGYYNAATAATTFAVGGTYTELATLNNVSTASTFTSTNFDFA